MAKTALSGDFSKAADAIEPLPPKARIRAFEKAVQTLTSKKHPSAAEMLVEEVGLRFCGAELPGGGRNSHDGALCEAVYARQQFKGEGIRLNTAATYGNAREVARLTERHFTHFELNHALWAAVRSNHPEVADLLQAKGADPCRTTAEVSNSLSHYPESARILSGMVEETMKQYYKQSGTAQKSPSLPSEQHPRETPSPSVRAKRR
jgi:hypothetical protein